MNTKVSMLQAQVPLRQRYQQSPDTAIVTDHAVSGGGDATDPFHSTVEPMDGCGVRVPVGMHAALGGPHDAPCPGDLLCAALAACQDMSIRAVAHMMGIELLSLKVAVRGTLDVRGVLGMAADVPIGFQSLECDVSWEVAPGTSPEMLARLKMAAERCCVVAQTLRQPPRLRTTYPT
jgi:uncharacterized OsmC-like protein